MPEQSDDTDPEFTQSTDTRWQGLNTLLAIILVASLPVIVGAALFAGVMLSTVTQPWFFLYSVVVLMAATWSFGKETLEAVQEVRGR
jgi:hypothetical protein